ncbi:endonuclease domain-containing protein [Blastomonas sp.]|uniref:endonuclease domain-containing protein n=1 Tax=Blastomonas sp. TaxID=1909299 RepID=UPI0035940B60
MRTYHRQPSGTVPRARQLRRDATDAERALWLALRENFPAARFRRQVPIGPYFADFLSFRAKLVIEVDGGQHDIQADYDAARTRFIEAQGYRVIRFWNSDVLPDPEGVLNDISLSLGEREGTTKSRKGEGDNLRSAASPSPSQALPGPLPLPPGEGTTEQ